jgi:hypothetical protein
MPSAVRSTPYLPSGWGSWPCSNFSRIQVPWTMARIPQSLRRWLDGRGLVLLSLRRYSAVAVLKKSLPGAPNHQCRRPLVNAIAADVCDPAPTPYIVGIRRRMKPDCRCQPSHSPRDWGIGSSSNNNGSNGSSHSRRDHQLTSIHARGVRVTCRSSLCTDAGPCFHHLWRLLTANPDSDIRCVVGTPTRSVCIHDTT